MNVDANKVIDNLTLQIASQAKQIAVLQVQVDGLYDENKQLKSEETEAN